MSLTEKEAFKLGFLARCAEEQLHGAALEQRIAEAGAWAASEKNAETSGGGGSWFKYNPMPISLSGLANTVGTAGSMILAAPFPLVGLGGAAAGYGAAKMLEPNIGDDDIKSQELAATYKLYADKAKARRKSRKYRAETGSEY